MWCLYGVVGTVGAGRCGFRLVMVWQLRNVWLRSVFGTADVARRDRSGMLLFGKFGQIRCGRRVQVVYGGIVSVGFWQSCKGVA